MDFEKARFNMVEQQIRPWDVLNTQLLDLLFHVKRENFVADNQKAIAFVDTELPLPNGSRMLQPKMEARILQELNIAADEKILEIGTGSGYLTAHAIGGHQGDILDAGARQIGLGQRAGRTHQPAGGGRPHAGGGGRSGPAGRHPGRARQRRPQRPAQHRAV